ncbi:MAG: SymE family type I addiction module toxin [Desulfitobacterium hafniense]|nr:SymE family type I addiction module toxin [Desulfitobacterium hafniense]
MTTRYLVVNCLYPSASRIDFMPLISIGGKWLEKAGFIPGEDINVEVKKHGELVMKLLPVAEQEVE